MFNKASELLEMCKDKNANISDIVIEKEIKVHGFSQDQLIKKMKETLQVMKDSAVAALDKEVKSVSGLTGGNSTKIRRLQNSGKSLSGTFINAAMAKAFSTSEVNASMGKIVAAPTAGASGILPSAIICQEKLNLTDDDLIKGLFTAAGIGEIIAKMQLYLVLKVDVKLNVVLQLQWLQVP